MTQHDVFTSATSLITPACFVNASKTELYGLVRSMFGCGALGIDEFR